jgi:hypothetical protein
MTQGYISSNAVLRHYWGICNNLLDVPLMLLFLTYFSTSRKFTRLLLFFNLIFVLFEAIVIGFNGMTVNAITIILGPGIMSIFCLCLYFFVHQSKIAIMNSKAIGKTVMAASLVFAYGSYGIIYTIYYLFKTPNIEDTFLIYFMVVTLSSMVISIGIIIERKRIHKIFELKIARKELADIYKDTKRAAPFGTAMLDFDRESWN